MHLQYFYLLEILRCTIENKHFKTPFKTQKREILLHEEDFCGSAIYFACVHKVYLLILDSQWSSEKDASFSLVCHWAF